MTSKTRTQNPNQDWARTLSLPEPPASHWSPDLAIPTFGHDERHPVWAGWLATRTTEVMCGKYGLAETHIRLLTSIVASMALIGLKDLSTSSPISSDTGVTVRNLHLALNSAKNFKPKETTPHIVTAPEFDVLDLLKEIGNIAGTWYDIAEESDRLRMTPQEQTNYIELGRLANIPVRNIWPKIEFTLSTQIRCLILVLQKRHHIETISELSNSFWHHALPGFPNHIITTEYQEKTKEFVS